MKYQESLDQKGLKVEQLSTTLQKRIKEVRIIEMKINNMKEDGVEDETKDELEIYEKTLKQLDDEVSKSISKFDLDKYEARKEVLEKNRVNRTYNEEQPKEESTEIVEKPKVVEQKPIEERIQELRKEVVIQPEKFVVEEDEEDSVQENVQEIVHDEVEFDKKATVKQKKGSTALIIMGIGAFILTWGAVNFFRERR